ncbi:hypothetical protein [Anaerococcus sp. AGMB09787]|uniref:hypothetical protein n=1 Tax=Anaerococcus sp. AGMB09787 TaxID=2922869 RepID=UPI001FAF8ACF|nr:hypothetical protein [Anaerococcus sp. AGMB09787]
MIEDLEIKVKEILKEDETILNYYVAKNCKSSYFIIAKNENNFITFRISDHPTSAFYSNRTFNARKNLEELINDIRKYMDTTKWYTFKYQDYFSLKVILMMPSDRIQLYIDNTMGIFDNSLTGIVFYQSIKKRKNRWEFNSVSESFQKELRKLFAAGLISDYRQSEDEILVYINQAGKFIMDYVESKYIDRFKEDEKDIDFKYIIVPDD